MMSGARGIRRITAVLAALVMAAACLPLEAMAEGTSTAPIPDLDRFEQYEVQDRLSSPELVKMNLFDYWLTPNQYDNDYVAYGKYERGGHLAGINAIVGDSLHNTHILQFLHGDPGYIVGEKDSEGNPIPVKVGAENEYLDTPRYGLVQKRLDNGYPVAVRQSATGNNTARSTAHSTLATESLAYLFDPSVAHQGKASYANVSGLFQLDDEGYYYYNSTYESTGDENIDHGNYGNYYFDQYDTANFAYFDHVTNKFHLYDSWAVTHAGSGNNWRGQFFPFNTPDQVFNVTNGRLDGTKQDCAKGAATNPDEKIINHYLGMTLEIPFVQPAGGKSRTNSEEDMIFHFSGDDDMWLFIDGVLVGDQGGIHGITKLEINFATGAVVTSGFVQDAVNLDSPTGKGKPEYRYETIRGMFEEAYELDPNKEEIINELFDEGENTFRDNTTHVIKMFYMERGHTASNLGIKFNLTTLPYSTLEMGDQDGQKLQAATFEIYQAKKDPITKEYTQIGTEPIFTGSTNNQGEMNLVGTDGLPILISNLPGNHFIMRETKVPLGYRSAGEMHLIKHQLGDGVDTTTLLSDPESPTGSKWSTGSYASAKETTRATTNIFLLGSDGQKGEQVVANNGPIKYGGNLFAVVVKWNHPTKSFAEATFAEHNDFRNWAPVYGDAENGYHMIAANDKPAFHEAIKTAATNNSYPFEIGASGQYEVEITNMPGDILQYLHARSKAADMDNVQYSVLYYWTNASDLSDLSNADVARLYSDDFTRTFAASFRALNIKDKLNIRKEDEFGNKLAGVTFELYKASDTSIVDGTRKVNDEALPHDSGVTDANGMITFPTDKVKMLTPGEYYLAEIDPLDGFIPRQDMIHIIVDDTGVYADAGIAGDGITVERGVGRLVASMHEFGVNDKIDETLHSIRFTPQYSAGNPFVWNDLPEEHHLHHGHEQDGYEAFAGSEAIYTADEGWSRIKIQQCHDESHSTGNGAYKEPLGEREITNLFTRDVTVVVANERKHVSVMIEGEKLLEGRNLEEGEFTFRLTAEDANAPMPAETVVTNSADGSFSFGPIVYRYGLVNANTYTYRIDEIKGNQSDIIYDDSYWIATVHVVEDQDHHTISAFVTHTHYDAKGKVITTNVPAESVTFTNEWVPAFVPRTGDESAPFAWLSMMALSALCAAWLISRKRKTC